MLAWIRGFLKDLQCLFFSQWRWKIKTLIVIRNVTFWRDWTPKHIMFFYIQLHISFLASLVQLFEEIERWVKMFMVPIVNICMDLWLSWRFRVCSDNEKELDINWYVQCNFLKRQTIISLHSKDFSLSIFSVHTTPWEAENIVIPLTIRVVYVSFIHIEFEIDMTTFITKYVKKKILIVHNIKRER